MDTRVTHTQALHFIWRYVRPYLPTLLFMLILSLLGTAAMVAQPFFYKAALDAIAAETVPSWETAVFAGKMVLGGVAMVLFLLTVEQLSNVLLARVESKVLQRVHSDAVAKAQRLSSGFHVNAFAGSTARKITRGTDSIETVLDRVWQNFFPAIILTIGFFIVLLHIAPVLGVVLTVGMAAYTALSVWLNLILGKYYTATDEQDSLVTGSLVDMLTGNALVKAFAAEEREDKRHASVLAEWVRKLLISWDISTIFVLIQFYFLVALEGAVLLITIWLWYTGVFTAGSFLVITFYIWQLWARLFEIGRHVRD